MDLHENFIADVYVDKEELVKFWNFWIAKIWKLKNIQHLQ